MSGPRRLDNAIVWVNEAKGGSFVAVPDTDVAGLTFKALGEDDEGAFLVTTDDERLYLPGDNGLLAATAMEQDVIMLVEIPRVGERREYPISALAPACGAGPSSP